MIPEIISQIEKAAQMKFVLDQFKYAVGGALTKEQQEFVTQNLGEILIFLHTDSGKKALQTFVLEWQTAPTK